MISLVILNVLNSRIIFYPVFSMSFLHWLWPSSQVNISFSTTTLLFKIIDLIKISYNLSNSIRQLYLLRDNVQEKNPYLAFNSIW